MGQQIHSPAVVSGLLTVALSGVPTIAYATEKTQALTYTTSRFLAVVSVGVGSASAVALLVRFVAAQMRHNESGQGEDEKSKQLEDTAILPRKRLQAKDEKTDRDVESEQGFDHGASRNTQADYGAIAQSYVKSLERIKHAKARKRGVRNLLAERLGRSFYDDIPVITRADGTAANIGTMWWKAAVDDSKRRTRAIDKKIPTLDALDQNAVFVPARVNSDVEQGRPARVNSDVEQGRPARVNSDVEQGRPAIVNPYIRKMRHLDQSDLSQSAVRSMTQSDRALEIRSRAKDVSKPVAKYISTAEEVSTPVAVPKHKKEAPYTAKAFYPVAALPIENPLFSSKEAPIEVATRGGRLVAGAQSEAVAPVVSKRATARKAVPRAGSARADYINTRVATIDISDAMGQRNTHNLVDDKDLAWKTAMASMDQRVAEVEAKAQHEAEAPTLEINEEPPTQVLPFRVPAGHPEVVDKNSYVDYLISQEIEKNPSQSLRKKSHDYLRLLRGGTLSSSPTQIKVPKRVPDNLSQDFGISGSVSQRTLNTAPDIQLPDVVEA